MIIKRIFSLGITLSIMFLIFGLCGCANKESPQERLKRICGINIPTDAAIEYDYFNIGPRGEFLQYTIFIFEENAAEFLESNLFTSCLCVGEHSKELPWLNNVTTEYLPDWSESHLFKKYEIDEPKGLQAMAFYYTDTNKLIVFAYLQ